jgi:hypothetical protein
MSIGIEHNRDLSARLASLLQAVLASIGVGSSARLKKGTYRREQAAGQVGEKRSRVHVSHPGRDIRFENLQQQLSCAKGS